MKKFFLFVIAVVVLAPVLVLADKDCPQQPGEQVICLDNPLLDSNGKPVTEASQLIGRIIKGALAVLGSLTLLMMVWGGFQWLTSAGNSERVEKGTKTMIWAIIGVVLIFSSYLLVDTLTTVLTKKP